MLGQGTYTRTEGAREGKAYARFFIEPVLDQMASEAAQRAIYREEERVEIMHPSTAQYSIACERVTDHHRREWSEEYKAFQEGREPALNGTPLEMWARLKPHQVLELKAMHLRTIEDVAEMSDLKVQQIPLGGQGLRDAARAYLDDAIREQLTEQQARRIDVLTAENAALKNQVEELGTLTRQTHAELMTMKNAQHPLATAIPGMADPLQAGAYQNPAIPREAPQSSFAAFANEGRRRGRPPKVQQSDPQEAA